MQVSNVELHTRAGPTLVLSDVAKGAQAALSTGASARCAQCTEATPAATALHSAFSQAYNTIFDVHRRIAEDHAASGDATETCMSNADLGISHEAYKSLHAAMDTSALAYLFAHVEVAVMESFFSACAQQARSGVLARHSTLHDEVRSHRVGRATRPYSLSRSTSPDVSTCWFVMSHSQAS